MESVCAGNRTVGSNPTLSASQPKSLRTSMWKQAENPAVFLRFSRQRSPVVGPIRRSIVPENRIFSESSYPATRSSTAFSGRPSAYWGSGLDLSRSTNKLAIAEFAGSIPAAPARQSGVCLAVTASAEMGRECGHFAHSTLSLDSRLVGLEVEIAKSLRTCPRIFPFCRD